MLLSVCTVVSLRRWLVLWSIIEAAEVDLTFLKLLKRLIMIPQSEKLRKA